MIENTTNLFFYLNKLSVGSDDQGKYIIAELSEYPDNSNFLSPEVCDKLKGSAVWLNRSFDIPDDLFGDVEDVTPPGFLKARMSNYLDERQKQKMELLFKVIKKGIRIGIEICFFGENPAYVSIVPIPSYPEVPQ